MKPKALLALTCLNTVALVGLVAGHALVDREAPARPGAATSPEAAALAARVEALEARLARLEPLAPPLAARPQAAAAEGRGEEVGAEVGAAPGLGDPAGPVTRGEVAAIVAATLEARAGAKAPPPASDGAAAAKAWAERPRRTLEEAARELQLDAHQTGQLRELYRGIERQSMRVLFGLPADADLEPLKAQLARAEHDPALKDELRERVAVNWARNSAEISVLWVQFDARLRRLLPPDVVARLYALDVRQEAPEFPDIKDMFFSEPKKE